MQIDLMKHSTIDGLLTNYTILITLFFLGGGKFESEEAEVKKS